MYTIRLFSTCDVNRHVRPTYAQLYLFSVLESKQEVAKIISLGIIVLWRCHVHQAVLVIQIKFMITTNFVSRLDDQDLSWRSWASLLLCNSYLVEMTSINGLAECDGVWVLAIHWY